MSHDCCERKRLSACSLIAYLETNKLWFRVDNIVSLASLCDEKLLPRNDGCRSDHSDTRLYLCVDIGCGFECVDFDDEREAHRGQITL